MNCKIRVSERETSKTLIPPSRYRLQQSQDCAMYQFRTGAFPGTPPMLVIPNLTVLISATDTSRTC